MARLMCFGGFVCVVMAPPLASAATCTWTGSGANANWSTPGNWDNCGGAHPVPISGDALIFPGLFIGRHSTNDFVGLSLPNRYVFGCGMDVSGVWRNLPAIYAVKGS